MKVQILDAPMSYGKSQFAIETICSEPDNFYFVVLPYLKEVDRYKANCNESLPEGNQLQEPSSDKTSKSQDLADILKRCRGSIVTTHKMLENLTQDHMGSIKNYPLRKGEKVLILDETIDLVRTLSSIDPRTLQADVENSYIIVNETTGRVRWNTLKEFDGGDGAYKHHEYLKNLCDTGMLYFMDGRYVVMELSTDFLTCFDRILVMTYRWSSSVMANYLTVNNIGWELLPLNENRVLDVYEYIADHMIIDEEFSIEEDLSKNGYTKKLPELKQELNQNIKQAMEYYGADLDQTIYTTFKTVAGEDMLEWFKTLSIGKYVKKDPNDKVVPVPFLSHTTLGTNEYSHCKLVVYGIDKHISPAIQSYFAKKDSSFPSAEWSLSSMLQWLFRGCVRDRESGEVMVAVILCPRMRQMAQEWLAKVKRQVLLGEVIKDDIEVIQLDAKTRRTKMQHWRKLKEANPILVEFGYTFNEYIAKGGPALKRDAKKLQAKLNEKEQFQQAA